MSIYCTIIDSDGGIWYCGRVTGAALYLQVDRMVKPAGIGSAITVKNLSFYSVRYVG
jgi:hypothetical protein